MKVKESDCVSCGLPCLRSGCPHYEVINYYCDECGDELGDEVYNDGDQDLCEYCLKEKYKLKL